jgi:hypothetical protein
MTLDASGNWLLGETSPVYGSRATISYNPSTHNGPIILSSSAFNTNNGAALWLGGKYDTAGNYRPFAGVLGLKENATDGNSAGYISFRTNGNAADPTERARITSAGFTQPVAYADTVSALGNTGTATTINLLNANVFTATLTGNCTFTLSNPIATGSSSFTLILTNDGTAGRTVAWAGGSFVFPGGASALSRTTTANAVDVWVFFTPNGGTTWYGNIAMKDMKA